MSNYSCISRESDIASIYIVDFLKHHRNQLASTIGGVENVFTLFFHHLVIHFSGILMLRELSESYNTQASFPWVNTQYARKPSRLRGDRFDQPVQKRGIYTLLRNMQLIPIELGTSIPYGYKQSLFLDKSLKLVAGFQAETPAFLPDTQHQIESLYSAIEFLCLHFDIPNSDVVVRNWQQHVARHVTDRRVDVGAKALVIGTRNDFDNRKKAINFMGQGKEVLGITHGEVSNRIYDEPVYGYSDLTLCRTLVDYGDYSESSELNAPLFKPTRELQRSSSIIQSYYEPTDQIKVKDIGTSKVLYVPTMYQDNYLYGPFHGYPNQEYRRWQTALAESVPNLTIKNHPKSRSQFDLGVSEENRRLEDCVNEYEIFIIDYLATGAILSLFTDSPVIYFNIGLRRPSKSFRTDLEQRCLVVPVDLSFNLKDQIMNGLFAYGDSSRTWSNIGLKKYSIPAQATYHPIKVIQELIWSKK